MCNCIRSMVIFAAIIFAANLIVGSSHAEPLPVKKKGLVDDPDIVPIAVWLQDPVRAPEYQKLGFNLFVGLWKGPTEGQLTELKKHGMKVICSQNDVGLKHLDDSTIVGWMHGDEPDNAQSLGKGKGYGPPILPKKVIDEYERIKKADPSRPVLLNLGQGVAWDQYIGRGTRRNHPEDYPEYLKGCDIASFDIYPAVHDHRDVAGKLWFVADGVARLRKWTEDRKPIWNCIECTHISNSDKKASPAQVKAEVWMSLIRGSRGLIYFVHQFKPKFIEAGLLADADMTKTVQAINKQIQALAPAINSATIADGVVATSSNADVPFEAIVKKRKGATYIFAVAMREGSTTATFKVAGLSTERKVEVLGEDRTLEAKAGSFHDKFEPWAVHLYRIGDE